MTQPTEKYKLVGSQTIITSTTVAGLLDPLYTLSQSATYYDGSARTVGAGYAATWSRYQSGGVTEALYATPVTSTLTHRWILAGSASAKSPSMASPHTWTTAMVLAGIAKNAGSYNAWDNAAPFTSGQFSGYQRAVYPGGATTFAKVWLYESAQGCIVRYESSAGAFNDTIFTIGDPRPSSSAMRGVTCESDDKVYVLVTFGNTLTGGVIQATFWGSGTGLFYWTNTNGYPGVGYFQPGSSTWRSATLFSVSASAMTSSGLKTEGGEFVSLPVQLRRTAGTPNDTWVCELPGIYMYSDQGTHPFTQGPAGGTPVKYALSSSNTGNADTYAIAAPGAA